MNPSASEQASQNTNVQLGVYTYKDEDGKLHQDKSLEVINEPQADAFRQVGYVYNDAATKKLAADRAKAEKEAE